MDGLNSKWCKDHVQLENQNFDFICILVGNISLSG
jgi:hypothetical protein